MKLVLHNRLYIDKLFVGHIMVKYLLVRRCVGQSIVAGPLDFRFGSTFNLDNRFSILGRD